jgi:hypothetical protein
MKSMPLFLVALAVPLAFAAPGRAAAQVGSWVLDGKVRACVTAQGHTECRTAPGEGFVLAIEEDGTYRQPGALLCGGEVLASEEAGTWRRNGKTLVLKPSNAGALVDDVTDCLVESLDVRVDIDAYRHKGRLRQGGHLLKLTTLMRGTIHVQGRSFPFTATGKFQGTQASSLGQHTPDAHGAPSVLATAVSTSVAGR